MRILTCVEIFSLLPFCKLLYSEAKCIYRDNVSFDACIVNFLHASAATVNTLKKLPEDEIFWIALAMLIVMNDDEKSDC